MGFKKPNYTQAPNELFDVLMREMGEAELRVVLAVVRKTFGYQRRRQFRMSVRKIAAMTGLSINGVLAGAEAAETRGLIRREQDGGVTMWVAVMEGVSDSETPEDDTVSASETEVSQPVRQGVSASETPSIKETLKKEKKDRAQAPRPDWADLYQEVFKRNAPKELWDDVSRELGDNPDLDRLREIFTRWKLEGWNRKSFAKMLAVYRDGWREPQTRATGNGNGSAHATPAARPLDIVRIYKD